jgi:integrase
VEYLAGQDYAANTIRLVLRTTKKVIASAVDDRGNPLFSKIWNPEHINPPAAVNVGSPELLTTGQIETAIANSKPIIKEFIATQAATGLRKGEMLALKVEDFDAAARVLHVVRTRGYFGETRPKTASGKRDVDLHPDVVTMLKKMLAGRTVGRLFPVTLDEIRRAFEQLGLKSHALRHFRYTHLQKSSLPKPLLDYWLGHSGVGMEKIYGHMAQVLEQRRKFAGTCGIGFRLPISVETQVKTETPAFLSDVESSLRNLDYSQADVRRAIQRVSGDSFEERLKSCLVVLRKPDAKVLAG